LLKTSISDKYHSFEIVQKHKQDEISANIKIKTLIKQQFLKNKTTKQLSNLFNMDNYGRQSRFKTQNFPRKCTLSVNCIFKNLQIKNKPENFPENLKKMNSRKSQKSIKPVWVRIPRL
jgi:hypothetical protein